MNIVFGILMDETENKEGRKMWPATCSSCGKDCEIPFEPTVGRPIYCRECFAKHKKRG